MKRHCTGIDPGLMVTRQSVAAAGLVPIDVMTLDNEARHATVAAVAQTGSKYEPCACGLVFDDAERDTIWPHLFLDRRHAVYPHDYERAGLGIPSRDYKAVVETTPTPDGITTRPRTPAPGSAIPQPLTRGIAPAPRNTPLGILQQNEVGADSAALEKACVDVVATTSVNGEQAARLGRLSKAFAEALHVLVTVAPPGPERSTAISWLRAAKMFGSAAIAGEPEQP